MFGLLKGNVFSARGKGFPSCGQACLCMPSVELLKVSLMFGLLGQIRLRCLEAGVSRPGGMSLVWRLRMLDSFS